MTQNEKDLLLKDICSRLPYGVKLQHVKNTDSIVELYSIDLDDFYCKIQFYSYKGKALTVSDQDKLLRPGGILRYKPYLFPLSSMTEEQKKELKPTMIEDAFGVLYYTLKSYDYFYKNHIDFRGLIPMDLAIDATGLNIY
jgi:hypothetical protein